MGTVELTRPRHLIPRWLAHGDLHLVVDDTDVYLRADDVEQLAGIPPWGRGETLLLDDDALVDVAGIPHYRLDVATARAEYEDTPTSRAFLTWLDEQLPQLLDPEVLESAHRVLGYAGAHTVAGAAAWLTRHGIRMGRDRLFDLLDRLHWITRATVDDDWTITPLAHAHDWLTLRPVLIPAPTREGRRRYLQIHVTEPGLAQLLRELEPHDPPQPPTLPLFD